jgi:hypothetical protein
VHIGELLEFEDGTVGIALNPALKKTTLVLC